MEKDIISRVAYESAKLMMQYDSEAYIKGEGLTYGALHSSQFKDDPERKKEIVDNYLYRTYDMAKEFLLKTNDSVNDEDTPPLVRDILVETIKLFIKQELEENSKGGGAIWDLMKQNNFYGHEHLPEVISYLFYKTYKEQKERLLEYIGILKNSKNDKLNNPDLYYEETSPQAKEIIFDSTLLLVNNEAKKYVQGKGVIRDRLYRVTNLPTPKSFNTIVAIFFYDTYLDKREKLLSYEKQKEESRINASPSVGISPTV